jgi:hypothetical protein
VVEKAVSAQEQLDALRRLALRMMCNNEEFRHGRLLMHTEVLAEF